MEDLVTATAPNENKKATMTRRKRTSSEDACEAIMLAENEKPDLVVPVAEEEEEDSGEPSMFGVVVADTSQNITMVSNSFTKLTGYSQEEAVGRRCGFLQGKNTNFAAVAAIRDALKKNQECRVSILNYRKDGSAFWNSLVVSPVMDALGRITNYVGIQMAYQRPRVDRSLGGFEWTTSLGYKTKKQAGRLQHKSDVVDAADVDELNDDDDDRNDTLPPVVNTSDMRSKVSFVAETNLPMMKGIYRVRAYKDYTQDSKESEIMVMIHGKVEGRENVPCRVHDQCFTSEVIGSLKCDCKLQLDYALDYINHECEGGLVIYMPQEGRGIGLANKIKAYSMQELGLDTVDANRILGFHDDYREYGCVLPILDHIGIKSVALMTNNPRKVERLSANGVKIVSRIPVICDLNAHSENYVGTKGSRMGHIV